MSRAFTFPGQGSQFVGMGKDLAAAEPAARLLLEEIEDALDDHLTRLMFDGPLEELTLTRNAQPALMAASLAVIRVLETSGKSVDQIAAYVAGHSLGEYSALAAAGALTVADTARLLRLRGEAMQRAVPVGVGAMAALIGADFALAKEVADEAAMGDVCTPANDNAVGQVVISGHKAAIERALAIASDKGVRRAILLPVSAPFHCSLMEPAAREMADALADITIKAPAIPVIANVTAEPTSDPDTIRSQLVKQVTGAVRWRESVLKMKELGVDNLVEAGAGKVLTGMVRRIDPDLTGVALQGPEDIEQFLKQI